jgi:hypothetical protein
LYCAVDYSSLYSISQINNVGGTTRSEYNISEYNIAEYNSGAFVNNTKVNLSGTGRVFQIGIEANISTDSLSIQQMDVYFKTGKLA